MTLLSMIFSSEYPNSVPEKCIPLTDLRVKEDVPTLGTQGEPFEEYFVATKEALVYFLEERHLFNGIETILPTIPPVVNIFYYM